MKTYFPLNDAGYVTSYLATRPHLEEFVAPYVLKDQLQFEKEMRGLYYKAPVGYPTTPALAEKSPTGEAWEFYSDNKNTYVDFSTFYFSLQRVSFHAATKLVSDKKKSVRARIWTYAAFDLWLNGVHITTLKTPVYQPINHVDVVLDLNEGENDVFFFIQNFGVRDTRNMLSLQIIDSDGITTTLPIEESTLKALYDANEWFTSLRIKDGKLVAKHIADFDVSCTAGDTVIDFSGTEAALGDAVAIKVSATVCGQKFVRYFEQYEKRPIDYVKRDGKSPVMHLATSSDEAKEYCADSPEESMKKLGHAIMPTLLCNVIANGGTLTDKDLRAIELAIESVNKRLDCSDFSLAIILRLAYTMSLPEKTLALIKDCALNFRYWMDEDGADAMCFWSENHALTFFVCQYLAGKLYPDEFFVRPKKYGREIVKIAERRIDEWLDFVTADGFEEFCAGGYTAVTVSALIEVYDFLGEERAKRAAALIDRIAKESAIQCFDGVHFAPMGRVYRGSLTPHISSVGALLYFICDDNVFASTPRYSQLGFTSYKFPQDLVPVMKGDIDTVFYNGRAEIHTKKTKNYILTSVASPRDADVPPPAHVGTEYHNTVILNEGFHGTSLFVPGVAGYQQHLFYAALSNKFFTFVTLPGSERDYSHMRPGYWYGNLIFPAVKQIGRELYCHYSIPDSVPTKFTHAYFPEKCADEVVEKAGYRFARVGDSYLALWCSAPLTVWDNDVLQGADLRAYGEKTGWYIKVGSACEDGSFEKFINACLENQMSYESLCDTLGKENCI